MLDFDVQRCTRRCAETGHEFEPGELFYSALVAEGADVVRYDFTTKAWDGPPDDCLGWWKSTMPDRNANKVNWAPNDVMLHYFEKTEGNDENADLRYVLALLLVRRKILKLDGTEIDDAEQEQLKLYCPRKETYFTVVAHQLSAARASEIQDELAELLFADAK